MAPEQSTFDKIRTRPRFKMESNISLEDFENHLKQHLKLNQSEFSGNINRETATIEVLSPEKPFWKPNLTLRAEKENGKTIIRGIFGPSSAVWTFFMFLYFGFSILWMVFITIWFVTKQIKINEYSWALPASFGMLFLILLTYLAAQFGQKKSKSEMEKLRNFAINALSKIKDIN